MTHSEGVGRYFLLACAITWVLTSPLAVAGAGWVAIDISPQWHMLGAVGPIIAAWLVTRQQTCYRRWLNGLTQWSVGRTWLFLSVGSPFVLLALGFAVVLIAQAPLAAAADIKAAGGNDLVWISGSILSAVAYGVGEEGGWRGFLLPRLQSGRSALRATIILAVLHAVWHVPFFLYRFEFSLPMAVGFFVGLAAGAICLTFLFNSTGGSALMAMGWHTTWNLVNQLALLLSDLIVATMSTCLIVFAVFIIWKWGPAALSPRPAVAW